MQSRTYMSGSGIDHQQHPLISIGEISRPDWQGEPGNSRPALSRNSDTYSHDRGFTAYFTLLEHRSAGLGRDLTISILYPGTSMGLN